ncbi:hypothetical protein GCM10010251_40210 [Streptomyces aurantiogriseus]|uniref:N-acetylmuramoyl-L-alanine amidase n=1 Tax=Streptomyces aurantiogriseus TaxID=66870 RepID=A0A918CEU8_9ACTN|nr:hypothetical protein GCM10010251_40210 [Streptomyces aurantiogriseus]
MRPVGQVSRLVREVRGRRPARLPGPLLVVLGCLPGIAAAIALALCASGVEHVATDALGARSLPPAGDRPSAPHTAARPRIVPRSAWLAGARRPQPPPRYDDKVVAVFVHHTDSPNGYACADAPRIIRYLYAGQTGSRDWDDIGYNFLVDRCGTIYEGRAGGVDRPVTGAHTQGFNHRTAGIAALGTFTAGVPVPRAMLDAIAALTAWKLGRSDIDPRAEVRLTSSHSHSRYAAGATATLPALAGHNDGYMTDCPGAALTARLPEIRRTAARLQGRTFTGTPQVAFRLLPSPPPTVMHNTSRPEVGNMNSTRTEDKAAGWTRAARSPWTVVCAVAAVVLGPAATTASALEQANKAPLHHAVRAEQQQAYIPTDTTRRRAAA